LESKNLDKRILYFAESIGVGIDLSAFVMELFMTVNLMEKGFEVKWQYRDKSVIERYEIDVLAYNDKSVQIIECSRHLPINKRSIEKMLL